MTDTQVLDAMMETLRRNPMVEERLKYVDRQYVETDERPFWARSEVDIGSTSHNRQYAEIIALFHDDVSGPRLERPRMGTCDNQQTRVIDGRVYTSDACGGTVHCVETRIPGAMRVDGKCLSCGTEVHRAGLLNES